MKPFKIKAICPEQSLYIQNSILRRGKKWIDGTTSVCSFGKYFVFDHELSICAGQVEFDEIDLKEYTFKEFMILYV